MIEYERTSLNGVPDYTAVEFEGRRHDYCLLIPVINEGARILTELGRAQKAGIDQLCDIVICDGGSTDGSMKRETLALYHVNTLLTKTGPGRQGAQLRMGMYFALDRNYKGILTIDGNNKDSIEDVPEFIAKLQEGYDLVPGQPVYPRRPRHQHAAGCAMPPCGSSTRRSSAWGRTSGSPIRPTPTAPTAAST